MSNIAGPQSILREVVRGLHEADIRQSRFQAAPVALPERRVSVLIVKGFHASFLPKNEGKVGIEPITSLLSRLVDERHVAADQRMKVAYVLNFLACRSDSNSRKRSENSLLLQSISSDPRVSVMDP